MFTAEYGYGILVAVIAGVGLSIPYVSLWRTARGREKKSEPLRPRLLPPLDPHAAQRAALDAAEAREDELKKAA